jgi:hypothetical protein
MREGESPLKRSLEISDKNPQTGKTPKIEEQAKDKG